MLNIRLPLPTSCYKSAWTWITKQISRKKEFQCGDCFHASPPPPPFVHISTHISTRIYTYLNISTHIFPSWKWVNAGWMFVTITIFNVLKWYCGAYWISWIHGSIIWKYKNHSADYPLKYANDLVLFAKNAESLQLGLNALHQFCKINRLTVNCDKSKMHFTAK